MDNPNHLIIFAAGNDSLDPNVFIGSHAQMKNGIAVGNGFKSYASYASYSSLHDTPLLTSLARSQSILNSKFSRSPGTSPSNLNVVRSVTSSKKGPSDGRIKPDLYGVGIGIISARSGHFSTLTHESINLVRQERPQSVVSILDTFIILIGCCD